MTETLPSTSAQSPSSLRRLVPRIFSRSRAPRRRRAPAADGPRQPSQGRSRGHREGVRGRREGPRRAEAAERRALHHPPAGRRADPRRPRASAPRRSPPPSCTTPSRTPGTVWTQLTARVRRRGRDARRRRHQARQGQVRRERPGGDRPQDDRRDVQGHPGPASSSSPTVSTMRARGASSRPRRRRRRRPETLEIYAPLAHRLGIQAIKSELEDLSFAVLHPKLYAEIDRLVRPAHPAARGVRAEASSTPSTGTCASCGIRGRVMGRPKQLLLRLPEDGRAGPRVRRHLRPHRHPCPGRDRARLLRGPGRHPRALDTAARALQGLHRHPQVQPVPVAAHDRHRPGRADRSRSRSAPTRCTTGRSSASPRTGSTRSG